MFAIVCKLEQTELLSTSKYFRGGESRRSDLPLDLPSIVRGKVFLEIR